MRKTIRRIVCMTAAILVLLSLAPAPVRAVDPVSAATMANALAQAITAYGASNGVSMMYDVTDTNGIGEGVHDLWDQFKTDINDNDVPTYDSLAVTTWSTIYKKVGNSVAINLSDTVVSYLDRFWNWLLSGPAEMTKVDNQFYEWSINQDGSVSPIEVLYLPLYESLQYFQYDSSIHTAEQLYNASNKLFEDHGTYANTTYAACSTTSGNVYAFSISETGRVVFLSQLANMQVMSSSLAFRRSNNQVSYGSGAFYDLNLVYNGIYYRNVNYSGNTIENYYIPVFASQEDGLNTYIAYFSDPTDDRISVSPYIGDTVPQNVYIPDNDDVNYQPLPYVGPLNIPWQNAWGDGESIDDVGANDIADALDQQIVDDGTLQLEGDNTVNPPIDDVIGGPDDYQVPGLADVFPFCIPFDIYNFLSALASDPVAPHFTAQLDFPEAIGGTQTIDIDFDSPTWNQLAQLLRLLELLAFIVGLALLTRSMFIRG